MGQHAHGVVVACLLSKKLRCTACCSATLPTVGHGRWVLALVTVIDYFSDVVGFASKGALESMHANALAHST